MTTLFISSDSLLDFIAYSQTIDQETGFSWDRVPSVIRLRILNLFQNCERHPHTISRFRFINRMFLITKLVYYDSIFTGYLRDMQFVCRVLMTPVLQQLYSFITSEFHVRYSIGFSYDFIKIDSTIRKLTLERLTYKYEDDFDYHRFCDMTLQELRLSHCTCINDDGLTDEMTSLSVITDSLKMIEFDRIHYLKPTSKIYYPIDFFDIFVDVRNGSSNSRLFANEQHLDYKSETLSPLDSQSQYSNAIDCVKQLFVTVGMENALKFNQLSVVMKQQTFIRNVHLCSDETTYAQNSVLSLYPRVIELNSVERNLVRMAMMPFGSEAAD